MKPQSLSEQLMLSTILINTAQRRGTGFFYHFVYNNIVVPVIITNKHVVNYKKIGKVSFAVHLKDYSNVVTGTTVIELEVEWIQHSNKDLCFCFANPIIEALKAQGKINITEIPTSQLGTTTPVIVNLGYYIKANELLEFRNYIEGFIKIKDLINNSKKQNDNKDIANA